MERLDAVAVIYRLASAISGIEHPIRFRWYRAMPVDAAVALPDGRVIAVVRQGTATDRTGFSKRLWRLRQGELPAAVLMLMPDEARLRHARRLVAGAPAIAYLALESDAASAGAGAPIWRTPSGAAFSTSRPRLSTPESEARGPARRRPLGRPHPATSRTGRTGCCRPCSGPSTSAQSTFSPTGPGSATPTWARSWD